MFGKNCFVMAAFLQFFHSFGHFCVASSSISLYNVLFGILLKETVVSLLHAAAFTSLSYVCMYYVCMYVCIMYVCTYVCMYVCTYVCMYVCMYVRVYLCI